MSTFNNTTFNNIIDKIINFNNNIFSPKYEFDGVDGIYKIFFKMLYDNINNTYKNKFQFIDEVIKNFYFSGKKDEKEKLLNLFCKIQKTYHTLNRFVFLYKYKKTNLVIDTDLQLNIINITDPNIICIYHINKKYLFKLQDILKLIYTILTNSYMFFAEPISIKNPYNNIPFSKSILYYISYVLENNIKIKFINFEHINIFLKFKQCDFNMTKFVNNYEYLLREYSIKNHINNSNKNTLKNEIFEILSEFNCKFKNKDQKILIDRKFPDEILINIFKPYLQLYLISKYSLIHCNKIKLIKQLYKKLLEFKTFNPYFGRKIIKYKSIIVNGVVKKVKSCEFNTDHIKFNNYSIENFMENHLSYKYDNDNENNDNENNDNDNDINNNNINNNNNNDDDDDEDTDTDTDTDN